MIKLIKLSLCLILCLTHSVVEAACNVGSNESINLGQNSSFTIYNNSITTSSNVGLSCTGLLGLGILSGDRITVTLKNNDGSGDAIPYGIYADSAYQYQFLTGNPVDYSSIGLLTMRLY